MSEAEGYVLSIDLGTSGLKVALVAGDGRIAGTGRSLVETLQLPDDAAEQDAEQVWRAIKQALRSALASSRVDASNVLAIICTSQYSSIVPVDETGRPTMNMVLWQDKRGTRRRLRRLDGYPKRSDGPLQLLRWLRVHGLPPLGGGLSLMHMRFIRYARPDVYERTAKFLEPMDYVAMRLCGRPAASQCTAFMSLLTDNRRLDVTDYYPQLVRQSNVDAEKLPELVPSCSVLGTLRPELASELGLSPKTKVMSGLNDTQASGIVTSAFRGRHGGIVVGNTGVMITHVPFKRTDVCHVILSMPSPVPDTYFVMAENGMSGGALERFLDLTTPSVARSEASDADRLDRVEAGVRATRPGSGGALFLPWIAGSVAPHPDSSMRGGFLNLGAGTTWDHLARSVLEGIALNLRWLRSPVERFAKREFSHFVFSGGGARSDAWSQIMADVLGAPVQQIENPQYGTCVGAAMVAFERLGRIGFADIAERVPIRKTYDPDASNRTVYDDLAGAFEKAFRATRPVLRALQRGPTRDHSTS